MATGAAVTQAKAGFWIRTIAYIVDAIIIGIFGSIVNNILFSGEAVRSSGLNLLIGLLYFVYFWSAQGQGQTLGMRIFNLKVVKTDGSQLDYVGALLRYVGLFISFVVFAIGVIWVAFDADKQGWHDKIAGTYVVKTQ